MRHIILDTETTGLSWKDGHRIIEIGAVEMVNMSVTGHNLHLYINPERDIDEDAVRIHGITSEFLQDKPVFADVAQQFTDYIGDDVLVIHNAPFDIGFLNSELARLGQADIAMDRVVDTLDTARRKYPGAQASLDALCRRFTIDNTHRDLHGALIDARLLADVFVELEGGREPSLMLDANSSDDAVSASGSNEVSLSGFYVDARDIRPARAHAPSAEELKAHEELLEKLKEPLWRQMS